MRQPLHSSPRRARGLSLLELLVALSIGIFLVGGVVSLFLASKRSYTETDRFARVAESGRFALVTLGRDLRQAGFFGAAGLANLTTDPDTGVVAGDCTAPADAYGFGTYFQVVRADGAGQAVGCVTDAVPNSDVIVIKSVRAVPLTDGARDNRTDDTGVINTPEAINNQRVYILANTDRGVLFRGEERYEGGRIGENAAKRLFGYRKNFKQRANRQIRLACDEIKRAMMRTAKAMFRQPFVNCAGKPRISKKQKLNPAPYFIFTKEQRRCGRRDRNRRWDSHIDVSWPSP